MLTKEKAIEVAKKYVKEDETESGIEMIILHKYTVEKAYGYVFHYTNKKYHETEDFQYAIVGNAPFLVEKETGRVIVFGTARPLEYYINGYENGTWEPSENGIWVPEE
ncbi:YrhB domain-containing protein [Aureisphaera galaxeae]|uniref:YrhB domain-containing protein n=1 Tax=Aureisphaera galaxeae TaxID=1538023 RepID=UPI00235096ED|nr:YrhB domain-containing protein [Aureisphaera galaxeae]MDC8006031.1 YrhB domain-containing protein [Aureisphaera galaxeae]